MPAPLPGRARSFGPVVVTGLALALLLAAIPWLLNNPAKPLRGAAPVWAQTRAAGYFRPRPDLALPYLEAAEQIAGSDCDTYGFWLGNDDWEYPFWALTGATAGRSITFTHVNVTNISGQLSPSTPVAVCGVVVINPTPTPTIDAEDLTFKLSWSLAPVAIYGAG